MIPSHPLARIRAGAAALVAVGACLAGCVERGDFGRVKQNSTWNDVVRTTGTLSASARGEPVSPFTFTDGESELRDRAWRFLVPAHDRPWLERSLADLVATRVLPLEAQDRDRAAYYAALVAADVASPVSRYRQLGDDAAADARLLQPLAELARRVFAADRVRLKTLRYAAGVSEADTTDAWARVAENRCLVAWIVGGLGDRIRAYRFALEHLVIEAPEADAVPAERSIARLGAALAVFDGLDVPPLAACAGDGVGGPAARPPQAVISARG